MKELALTRLPPRLRERLFRAGGAILPGLVESRARYGAIDMSGTAAFSDELNYFPSVCLNVRGREPRGTVAPDDVATVRREVSDALLALRDPWTGAPVVAAVHPREELFRGPLVSRAPDLLLELHLDRGYSWNVMPSAGAPPPAGAFRRLGREELLGRKGRSLPGSHRPRGFYCAAGPRVREAGEVDAHIADATATLLARMDVAVPPDALGRVLWEALVSTSGVTRALPVGAAPAAPAAGDDSRVEARLRALGYIE
jgi:predicted AlkP superfamily phosphohydrolase/phosphomutase